MLCQNDDYYYFYMKEGEIQRKREINIKYNQE